MTLALRIEHTDNSTDTLEIVDPDNLGDSLAPSLTALMMSGKVAPSPDEPVRGAEVTVYRDSWAEVETRIDSLNDEFYIEENGTDIFGGRLNDSQYEEQLVSVILDGPKRDALDAKPSGGNDVYDPQPDDSILTNEILTRIPTVTSGTITQQTQSIPFSEAQASPGKSITKLAEATGAEVEYTPDGSPWQIDYVSRLGTDKTDQTLSPGDGLFGTPTVREKTREELTHIRVLGAQSGTAQVSAESVVSSFDPATDRPIYGQVTDKDIQKDARAKELADRYVEEYDGDPIFIEVEVLVEPSQDIELGDSFTISIPERNINDELRVVNLRRMLDESGDRYRAVFSNRKLTRDVQGDLQTRSVDEFREGNAGQYFFNSERVNPEPINNGEPLNFDIRYPTNVIGDISAKLVIKSQPYRGRVVSSGHTHSVTIPDHDHNVTIGDHNHDVTISDHNHDVDVSDHNHDVDVSDHSHDVEISAPNHLHEMSDSGTLVDSTETTNPNNEASSVPDHTHTYGLTANVFSSSSKTQTSDSGGGFFTTTSNGGGFFATTSDGGGTTTTTSDGGGTTTTTDDGGGTTETTDSASDLEAGVNTFGNETVSNVAVTLNGNTIASGLDATVNEEIDITGLLNGGDNAVEITSDTLGEITVIIVFEGIKNSQ